MAQRSKKQHIVETALPLFLENGFKGTSIDMVVRASGVSKPTVYNHFPDKSALMLAVLENWIENNKPVILPVHGLDELDGLIEKFWLNRDSIRLYAIVIGEGFRFPAARELFLDRFDRRWRAAFEYLCDQIPELDHAQVEQRLDRRLLEKLMD